MTGIAEKTPNANVVPVAGTLAGSGGSVAEFDGIEVPSLIEVGESVQEYLVAGHAGPEINGSLLATPVLDHAKP